LNAPILRLTALVHGGGGGGCKLSPGAERDMRVLSKRNAGDWLHKSELYVMVFQCTELSFAPWPSCAEGGVRALGTAFKAQPWTRVEVLGDFFT
jgi:hypothetical protein